MTGVQIQRFGTDGEIRDFEKGRFEVVELGGLTLGRATYQPGWKWSTHVGPTAGASICPVEHVGMVVSGRAAVSFPSGAVQELGPGDLFHIKPGHDSWVVGDQPDVSLHFLGADEYAK